MDLNKLKEQINKVIERYSKDYPLDDILLFKFNARYNHLLRELQFDLATFGIETLIRYFNSWSNHERFSNLEYYSNLLAKGDDSRNELFVLYATVNINKAIVSFLRSFPKDKIPKQSINQIMFELHRAIELQSSIPDQLEVWKRYFNVEIEGKIEVPEMFRETLHGRLGYLHKFEKDVELLCRKIFPESTKFYTTLMIPDKLFNFNFEFVQDDPDYTFWFLKYNAKKYFEIYIMSEIYDDLESPLRSEHIKGYLQDLHNEEQIIRDLVSTHQIHSAKDNQELVKETEMLRILEGYYEFNYLKDVHSARNITVELYARHVFLKKYLKSIDGKSPIKESQNLIEYFSNPSEFMLIMDLLVQEGKCEAGTFIWLDRKSGYKSEVAYLFRILHTRGYFRNNHLMPIEIMKELALKAFGVEIGIQTLKNSSSPPQHFFDFIPTSKESPEELS